MPFAEAVVVTNKGKAMAADRQNVAATYTTVPKYCAIGTGATGAARTAVVTDTALTTEVETRATGVVSIVTTSVTGDTFQVTGTINITATRAIDEHGVFDQSALGGNMAFSATKNVINLNNGDSITPTWKEQFT